MGKKSFRSSSFMHSNINSWRQWRKKVPFVIFQFLMFCCLLFLRMKRGKMNFVCLTRELCCLLWKIIFWFPPPIMTMRWECLIEMRSQRVWYVNTKHFDRLNKCNMFLISVDKNSSWLENYIILKLSLENYWNIYRWIV